MKMKAIAEACMWLPGFSPDEDPLQVLGPIGTASQDVPVVAAEAASATEHKANVVPKRTWPVLSEADLALLTGPVAKYEANVAAIELLRTLENGEREATSSERAVLNRFTGWGGLPQAFNVEQNDTAWASRARQLKQLLTQAEYAAALDSTPNSHYTPLEVVDAVWSAVRALGFAGGRIVEPCSGTGYFLGAMPGDMARNSLVTAVELDAIPARIAKVLYQPYGVVTHQGAFESVQLPPGFYDLAIGNVPFGSYGVAEKRNVAFADFSVHNYFFARALELVRPGGLVAFITSSFTLDAGANKVRRYLAGQAELVAAIRLPSSTFKGIAGTEVVTDLVILQKLARPQAGVEGCGWIHIQRLASGSPLLANNDGNYREPLTVNEYFAAHPERVIGKLDSRYVGLRTLLTCSFDGDLRSELARQVATVPSGIYQAAVQKAKVEERRETALQLEGTHRPGLTAIDGKVFEVLGDKALPVDIVGRTLERVLGMIHLRDCARKLIKAQAASDDDGMLSVYRTALNVSYDAFVAKNGYVNERANRRAFKADPDLPLLLSLEVWSEEEQRARKAPIFERRTAGAYKRVSFCETPPEALQVSLAESARVVPLRIAELTGKPVDDVMSALEDGGHVFLDPDTGAWEHADAYLSGRVHEKLAVAESCGQRFERNVAALKGVLPIPLVPGEITARVGSTWIPTGVYEAFLSELFGKEDFKVTYEPSVGAWNVEAPYFFASDVRNTQVYGTERVGAVDLFEAELNQRKPTVHNKLADGKTVVDAHATIAAREKQHELKQKFVEWLWSDMERSEELAGLYNRLFNSTAPRRFDGKHLVLPGMSTVYSLRKHQRDAVWRIVSSQYATLLAHVVGAGKTLEMICAGVELRRLGQASKVLYVVPNHMLFQFGSNFMEAYPSAHVLLASKEDLQGERRRLMLARIATCDWDAIVVTQATFESMKVSNDYMETFIKEELAKIEAAIRLHSEGRSNKIVKQLARAKKSWRARLEKLNNTRKKEAVLDFEDLGVDWLMIDESHYAKNLYRFSKMERIAGLPATNSDRAFDLFVKTRCVMERRGDQKGVTFATGTPISNTMAELWTVMRFLQQPTLERYQIDCFDSWAANFAESVTALELAPDGSGYRMQTRFARFVNLPELMSIFRMVADIRTAEMLDLPTPKVRKETLTVEGGPELADYVRALVERAERIRGGGVAPSEDNMLKITGDGRKAALDLRLVNPLAAQPERGKIRVCADNVYRIWSEYAESKGAQVVFCDLSTPRNDGGFNAYEELRSKLVCMGIPSHEIAFIHDYDTDALKDALFRSVRRGAVRVVMGSTEKLGVGTNIQERLIALHHLDSPWRPSDLEQREGRIARQGNTYPEVFVFTYVTKGSFDAYMYQLLHSKARFIAQIMTGNAALRTAEDAELAALSYAEIKALASGNPLVLRKAGVDAELAKLNILYQAWARQSYFNKRELEQLPGSIRRAEREIVALKSDLAKALSAEKAPSLEVKSKRYTGATPAAKALSLALLAVSQPGEEIGAVNGFKLVVERKSEGQYFVNLYGAANYSLGWNVSGQQVLKAAHQALSRYEFEQRIAGTQRRLAGFKAQAEDLAALVDKPFEKQARLDELRREQIEIDAALDLDKGDMSAVDDSVPAEEAVAA
ncbi:DEAD/DEAH box helicase family protein [Paracidovorax citrulli]|uniref:DEAD/DEAH box helicase family protein n=1 Tax=Paracidovorax citrulli TaxID=80869 RepID=UPI003FA6E7C0